MKTRAVLCGVTLGVLALLSLETCAIMKTQIEGEIPDVKGETWDYVVIGHSAGTSWARYYGAFVEADLGVKIVYHDYHVDGQRVRELRDRVRRNEKLREGIRSAEVVTIGVGLPDMSDAIRGYELGRYDREEVEEKVAAFGQNYRSMLDEILMLASPARKIIRVVDFYLPEGTRRRENSMYDAVIQYWNAFNACIHQSAEERKILVAPVCRAFHGPAFEDDPVERGYIDFDGIHPSEQGKEVIAAEVRKLGYQLTQP